MCVCVCVWGGGGEGVLSTLVLRGCIANSGHLCDLPNQGWKSSVYVDSQNLILQSLDIYHKIDNIHGFHTRPSSELYILKIPSHQVMSL